MWMIWYAFLNALVHHVLWKFRRRKCVFISAGFHFLKISVVLAEALCWIVSNDASFRCSTSRLRMKNQSPTLLQDWLGRNNVVVLHKKKHHLFTDCGNKIIYFPWFSIWVVCLVGLGWGFFVFCFLGFFCLNLWTKHCIIN